MRLLLMHDIVVRIRILILGSIPLLTGRDSDTDPAPEPAITFNMASKNHFYLSFFAYYFLLFEATFFKDKKSQNSMNRGFYYYFCLMIEGSGAGSRSVRHTNGSGSGRPKIIRILRIVIRIRIRNTATAYSVIVIEAIKFSRYAHLRNMKVRQPLFYCRK